MKYDRKIKIIIRDIKFSSDCYLEDVKYFNECSTTDRIIENIIGKAKELEEYYYKRFENDKVNQEKDKKEKVK